MLCFFGVVNSRTISRFVLSEKVQKQSAHSAKQKFLSNFCTQKFVGFQRAKPLAHTSVCGTLCKKRKPPRLNSRYFA